VEISSFIRELPKAELHLHLEGTVTPVMLAELSRRHPTPLPVPNNRYAVDANSGRVFTEEEALELYRYTDFVGFLMAFKAVTERLRTPEDYEYVAYEMLRGLREQNVLHAEVFVSVGVVLWRGQDFAPLFAGLERGRARGERDFGVSVLWIFDAVRHFGAEEAQMVVDLAIERRGENVVGVGIGGDERRAGAELFKDVYSRARSNGLRLSVHAGENVGAASIWAAINIGAERIGHGLHAPEDPELMETLAERQLPVEVCISSNVLTGCCRGYDHHPVRKMFDAGVMVTLNTDDPAMFHTTLNREFHLAQKEFGFSNDQLRELARNSFEASWLAAENKIAFLDLLDAGV